jgi:hypothetical protein
LIVHVDVSQVPVSRQLSVALVVSYPVSQTREALDPYVVVVNVTFPLLTLKEEPQSEKDCHVITCNKKSFNICLPMKL